MPQPYVGEIKLFAGNFAPVGWQFCDGTLIPIAENETLFQLLGTTYGGDGQETFAVPDLRGRVPMHQGNNLTIGEAAGTEYVTLTSLQIPMHTHVVLGTSSIANDGSPANNLPAQTGTFDGYQTNAPTVAMAPQSCGGAGGSQPHDNMQPYLCINFIISLYGVFPTQS